MKQRRRQVYLHVLACACMLVVSAKSCETLLTIKQAKCKKEIELFSLNDSRALT